MPRCRAQLCWAVVRASVAAHTSPLPGLRNRSAASALLRSPDGLRRCVRRHDEGQRALRGVQQPLLRRRCVLLRPVRVRGRGLAAVRRGLPELCLPRARQLNATARWQQPRTGGAAGDSQWPPPRLAVRRSAPRLFLALPCPALLPCWAVAYTSAARLLMRNTAMRCSGKRSAGGNCSGGEGGRGGTPGSQTCRRDGDGDARRRASREPLQAGAR